MTGPASNRRRAAARLLLALAGGAAALTIVIAWTGGFSVRPYGVRLSAHGALRPMLVAMLCLVASVRVLDPAAQTALTTRVLPFGKWLPIGVTACAATLLLAMCLAYGTRAAGGSDPYGYVSQSLLWRAGDLRVHQDFVAAVPWPNADWSFTPLGYWPSANHTLVPTYAPGLPLLMLLFTGMFGSCGPYLVSPLCGALLVILTYAIGAQVSGRAAGAAAAVCVASSPTVLLMAMWPMSDVPAATFWTASLLLACRASRAPGGRAAVIALVTSGAAAGIAIVIRPNLLPLALFPTMIGAWPVARHAPGTAVRRVLAFGAAVLPFVLFVGWFYHNLYGSPLRSGYGDSATIFAWGNLRANLARYPKWLLQTQGALAFLFTLSVFLPGDSASTRWQRRVLMAFIAGVLGCYLFYIPFNAWWFLRFLLPAAPLVFVLAADVAWQAPARLGTGARVFATVIFAMVMVNVGVSRARALNVWDLGEGEQKYADVGRYVATRLPANAVLIAMQHSGSVRFYSGRPTLRFDVLEPEWLDRAIAHLRAAGYEPYVLLEKYEVPLFRARFADTTGVTILDGLPSATHLARQVMIYRTDTIPRGAEPDPIPATSGCSVTDR